MKALTKRAAKLQHHCQLLRPVPAAAANLTFAKTRKPTYEERTALSTLCNPSGS